MKFGICVNLLAGTGGVGIEFAEAIKENEYDYIELPLGEMMLLDKMEYQALRQKLSDINLPCIACNNFIKKGLKLVGDKIDTPEIHNHCERAIQTAHELGASKIVLGSPWAKSIPEGFPREKAWEQMKDLCIYLGPVARKYGVLILLEHNNKEETNHLNQLWEVNRLVEEVNHPNIQLLVDYYHLRKELEPTKNVVEFGSRIKHIHFAKIENRRYPYDLNEDENYKEFIQALRQIGYDDSISIEAYSSGFNEDARKSMQFLRKGFAIEK